MSKKGIVNLCKVLMKVTSYHPSCILGSKLQIPLILKGITSWCDSQNTGIIGAHFRVCSPQPVFNGSAGGEGECLGSKWWLVHFIAFVLMKKAIVLKEEGALDYWDRICSFKSFRL